MNICILASIGCQNLGDELILKNEVELLRQRFGKHSKIRVFTYDLQDPFFTDDAIQYREYFPIGSKDPKNTWKNITNYTSFLQTLLWSDLVVIGGGGIFYETEVQSTRSPLDLWIFRMKWIQFFKKKCLFFSVGIDVNSDTGKQKIKKIFSYKEAEVTVRDRESFFLLQELGIKSEVVQDPVFSENSSSKIQGKLLGAYDSRNFSPKDFSKYNFSGKKIGVALRKGYIGKTQNDRLEELMIEELLKTIEEKGGEVIFLPHSFHKLDPQANDYTFLKKFMNEKRQIRRSMMAVGETYSKNEIDICVGMRLHSIILSYVYGIDILALSYSKKTHEAIKKLSK